MNIYEDEKIDPSVLFTKVKEAVNFSPVKSSRDAMSRYFDLTKLEELEELYGDVSIICLSTEFNVIRTKYNV